MRIKHFSVRWYGPLKDTGRVTLGNLSLFFGKNEYGKTLTIDALVKLLFRRGRQSFSGVDRVDAEPDGYLIIEDDNGREAKLPEEGDLASITGLTPQQCGNIFIIRNSDLSIASEGEFYRDVTDRLTGLKSQEISRIKGQLADLGKLTNATSTASLRNWAGEKLNARTKTAQALTQTVQELREQLRDEEFDRIEESLLSLRETISQTRSELETLEDARKREKHEKGSRAYEALIDSHQKLLELEVYSTDDANQWGRCEGSIADWEEEKRRLQEVVNRKREDYEQKTKALHEQELEFEVLSDRKRRIDNEVLPETRTYEMGSGKLESERRKSRFYAVAAITSAVLLLTSILGLILNPTPFFYGLFAFLVAATGTFATLSSSLTRERAHLDAVFERIRLGASRFELAGESVEKILSNIREFDEEYSRKNREVEKVNRAVSSLDGEIRHLEQMDMADLEKKISEAANVIQDLVVKSGVRTLQEYSKKLQLKLNYDRSVDTQREVLESHFGSKGEKRDRDENLSYWREEIDALREFEHKAVGTIYDERAVSLLNGNRDKFLSEEQELERKARQFYEQLREIERSANEVLQSKDDYLYCATSVDLQGIEDKLSEFIAGIEAEKNNALTAMRIFETLEQREEQKIAELFGKDSLVSKHFRDITGGTYQEVDFVLDDPKEVRATLVDGCTLAADKLSGGAYDQLYLSIRLALGERLLKGTKGFFIMDDPFIKADKDRLHRQVEVLRRISEAGWQILYFTAKDEVVQALKPDVAKGSVDYIEIDGFLPSTGPVR